MEEKTGYVNSILHAMQIVNLFAMEDSLGVTDVSKRLGIHKATAFKIMQTLKSENWLMQDPKSKNYSLGMGMLPVARAVNRTVSTKSVITQLMSDLAGKVHEDIVLCELVGKSALCVIKIESDHFMVSSAKEGSTLPLHLGATGLVLLAYQTDELIDEIFDTFRGEFFQDHQEFVQGLQNIREQGYKITCSNYDKGISAVGVPVFNRDGVLQYSLSIVGPVDRMLKGGLDNIKGMLMDTAREIGNILNL